MKLPCTTDQKILLQYGGPTTEPQTLRLSALSRKVSALYTFPGSLLFFINIINIIIMKNERRKTPTNFILLLLLSEEEKQSIKISF